MTNRQDVDLDGIRERTIAEHVRKAARDLAIVGVVCGAVAIFYRERLSADWVSNLWMIALMGCVLYIVALYAEFRVLRRRASKG